MARPGIFLTAEWRYLAMVNYEVDPAVLSPFVPDGTELDLWQGRCLASMVGFLFLDTRLLGVPIPFHRNFEEVNLRFYVRRRDPDQPGSWRRGVVFVKEIVPKRFVAWAARLAYGERYVYLPMEHRVGHRAEDDGAPGSVEYRWATGARWNRLGLTPAGAPQLVEPSSEEAFITEHYWGYATRRRGSTVEYQVEHPTWRVWQADDSWFDCDVAELYGPQFVQWLSGDPSSAFLAEGSPVMVRRGQRIRTTSSPG